MTAVPITRARLTDVATGDVLTFQFNPESLTRTKGASWQRSRPQYVGQGAESLSAKLLFDDFDHLGGTGTSVAEAIGQLFDWLTVPQQHSEQSANPRPPTLQFQWGDGVHFAGVLKQVSVQYLRFGPDGRPERATATINLQAVPDDPKPTNPTSGGPPGRAAAQLGEGDTLSSLAQRHYGDPNLWRAIAISNDIADPSRVLVGTHLLLPRRTDALNLSRVGDG